MKILTGTYNDSLSACVFVMFLLLALFSQGFGYSSFLIAIPYVEASRQAVYPKIEEGATF